MKKILYILLLLLGFSFVGEGLAGQELLQVVEREFSSSVPYSSGESLEIVGEKADITIEVHSKSTIEYKVKVIAKNKDKTAAEKDLKKMQLLEDKVGNTHFLRNYIEIKNASEKPTSGLKVVYTLKVPKNCQVKLKNYFGKITVSDLIAKLEIKSEFTPITLINIDSKVNVESTYGDLIVKNMKGWIRVNMNRAKISMYDFNGDMDIDCILSEVLLDGIKVIKKLSINSDRSTVDLSIGNDIDCVYQYDLEKVDWTNSQGLLLRNEKGKVLVEEVKNKEKALVKLIMDTGSLKVKTVNKGQVYE